MFRIIAFVAIFIVALKASKNDEKDSSSAESETALYPRNEIYKDFVETSNNSRINGGVTVQRVVPYQVSLQAYRRNNWYHFCGGSIISPHHVLTAAHCVHQMQTHEIHVVAGTLTWRKGGERHRVLTKRQHPQFSMSPQIVYDVAILKVSPPFNLHKSTVGAINLGTTNRIGEKVRVKLTGWGATSPTPAGGVADNLQQLSYQTLSNAECARKGFRVTNSEICALDAKGRGSCVVSLLMVENGILSYGNF